jgi:hypothetical protein
MPLPLPLRVPIVVALAPTDPSLTPAPPLLTLPLFFLLQIQSPPSTPHATKSTATPIPALSPELNPPPPPLEAGIGVGVGVGVQYGDGDGVGLRDGGSA